MENLPRIIMLTVRRSCPSLFDLAISHITFAVLLVLRTYFSSCFEMYLIGKDSGGNVTPGSL